MKQKSLRQLAKELGVSHSYIPQVRNGKRPASDKVVNVLSRSGKQNTKANQLEFVKQSVKQEVGRNNGSKCIIKCPQGNSNPCFRLERAMS